MNAFKDACGVEAEGQRILMPWLRNKYKHVVLNAGGRLAIEMQQLCDGFANLRDDTGFVAFEFKFEQKNPHGNLFLESWSNKSRLTPGWMLKCDATLLLYYFLDSDELYALDLPKLRRWAFAEWQIAQYPERKQGIREQKNDTWGWCVPIEVCLEAAAVQEGKYAPHAWLKGTRQWLAEYEAEAIR